MPALLDRARQRAAAEGSPIDFQEGDAQALPYPDAHFHVVLSVFGVMFAPIRIGPRASCCGSAAGREDLGLCCWIPNGFGGEFFRIVATVRPGTAGAQCRR